MLKKCFFSILWTMLVAAGVSGAATMTPVTPSKDGNCYLIGTAAELYGFAAIVNGTDGHTAEPTACGVLTADIVVNEHVLKNASGESCVNDDGSYTCSAPTNTWTPIGTSSSKPFQGTFDGLGHTISGLFNNNTSSATKYIGLFGYVGGGEKVNVSIKNVGVEDSYFSVNDHAGGIVGTVSGGSSSVLSLENVFSSSVLYINGNYVGGLIGYVAANWTMNITNAYNSGSIFGTGTFDSKYYAGLVGYISGSATVSIKNAFNYGNLPSGSSPLVYVSSTVYSVENSFYLGSAAQGKDKYGLSESLIEFSNGTVLGLLRQGENGSAWKSGSDHPILFVKHSATLHYSTGVETIYFVEGYAKSLPTIDKSGNPVLGWYDNEGLTGTKYTEIPASANRDLSLYPKVMKLVGGCYEISDADMLYAFAAAVNNGNAIACGKLTANIVVNQNVLTTADGTSNVSSSGEYIGSNSASFRQWTPIGYNYRPFKGTFDGQGHTISGLYFNDPSSSDVGLFSSVFGDPKPVTIENVGLVDSYFRGNSSVGGLVGNAKGLMTIKNSFNAGSINAQGEIFGGLVGYSWKSSADVVKLTISNSYNTGSLNGGSYGGGLVGSAVDLIISNSYNTGSVTVSKTDLENGDANCVGGFAASADKVTITNSYNYGSVSSPDGARKDDFVTSFSDGSIVTNSFFISECDFEGNGATKMSSTQFSDGTVFAALRSAEGGEVWRQYSGDVYPTFVEKNGTDAPSPMRVAVLHYSETDSVVIAYTAGTAFTLPTTLPDGSIVVGDWYKSNNLSGDTYTQIAATENGDLAFYAKAMKLDGDGYYEIADADMLFKFADLVNTQNSTYGSAKAKLTADIVVNQNVLGANNANVNADGSYNNAQAASSFTPWTPIGNNSNPFKGSFNGKGHTISGLYFNNSETDNVGLFGYTSGAVTIDNVGLVDSYFRGKNYVGSLVGQATGSSNNGLTVIKSYNKGAVTGTGNVGGLVGKNGNVKFSYNAGPVTGSGSVGGLVGSNSNGFEINGSYNVGLVKKGEGLGNAVLGYGCPTSGQTSAVKNVYYLEGAGDECSGAHSMTSYEFADGFVATILHNDNNTTGANIWGQVVGTDKTPVLTGEIVFPITLDNSDNCYEISNADELYIFAAIVNSGFKSDACGKLTENIVVNENVLTSAGELNTALVGGFKEWTPIGFETNSFGQDISFRGTFHGQGHTISGLYFNDTDVDDVGLFGDVSGTVTIDGVGLVDSYINAGGWVGGLVGFASGSLTISNSYNASSVTSDNTFGGLVGAAGKGSSLAISNSYNVGSLNGGGYGGGLVGYANALVVSNSYNAGSVYVSGDDAYVGGITSSVDDASTVTNSFNYGAISYPTGNSESKDDLVAEGVVTVTNSFTIGKSRFDGDGSTKMTPDKFKDGTVFAALHSAEDGEVWRQYENDAYPTFAAKTGTDAPSPMHVATLHYSETDSEVIAYTEGTAKSLPTKDKEGKALSGWTTSADGTGDVITKIPTSATGDLKLYPKAETFVPNAEGYYEIATVKQLYEFAAIVNGGNSTAKAKLMNDIVVNENVLNSDGSLNSSAASGFDAWTPIGTSDKPFAGVFDGQGYWISGLYVNDDASGNVGLFGAVSANTATDAPASTIKNVGVVDSYFSGDENVGAIVGLVKGTITIQYVYSESAVAGSDNVGGLVGDVGASASFTASEIYNAGSVTAPDGKDHGGILGAAESGAHAQITDGFNYGTVSNGGGDIVGGADASSVVYVSDVYHLAASSGYDGYSAADFENGTVLSKLREQSRVWVQNPGDKYPTIDVNASGSEPYTIVLDWTKAEDKVNLKSWLNKYGDGATFNVSVAEGKTFYADGKIYRGDISEDVSDICDNNKTLYPISGVELETVDGKLVATLNGDSQVAVMIPTDVHVDTVVYKRNVMANTFTTVMLPFSVPATSVENHSFYKFKRVADDPVYTYAVKVSSVTGTLKANRPYIMIDSEGSTQIKFNVSGEKLVLNTTAESYDASSTYDGITWTMRGVFKYKQWLEGDSELGHAYGFAAQEQNGSRIGQFVKLGKGASIVPMRMYLTLDPLPTPKGAPGRPAGYGFSSIASTPEFIGIDIEDDDEVEDDEEETMVVNRVKVIPTVIKDNRWFDMKGRALNGKPTAKGTYYHNGKKVIIK